MNKLSQKYGTKPNSLLLRIIFFISLIRAWKLNWKVQTILYNRFQFNCEYLKNDARNAMKFACSMDWKWTQKKNISRVTSCQYLGTIIHWDKKKMWRAELSRQELTWWGTILCSYLNINLRNRVLNRDIFTVLRYEMESWTQTEDLISRINAFEIWTYRRRITISWKV